MVLEEAVAPHDAGGRFNLRVDGRLVARRAGDGAVVGPTRVAAGQVDIGERAAAGTAASAYARRSNAATGPGAGT